MNGQTTGWPPPWAATADNMVAAPAGERSLRMPTTGQLEWAHKALQVLFLFLALLGLLVLLGSQTPRAILRGAARKHAIA